MYNCMICCTISSDCCRLNMERPVSGTSPTLSSVELGAVIMEVGKVGGASTMDG